MDIGISYPTLLVTIVLYSLYLKHKNFENSLIFIFLLSVISKLFLIYLEYVGVFQNKFTIRDEATNITYSLSEDIIITTFGITPGDYFLFYLIRIFIYIFQDDYVIKLLPVFFSLISFHYLLKIFKIFKIDAITSSLILFIMLFWPSYLLFHYSITKEFLQFTFLIPFLYYSFRLLDKINPFVVSKYCIFLVLFTYSHRGFEAISLIITFVIVGIILIKNRSSKIINLFIFAFLVLFFAFITYNIFTSNGFFLKTLINTSDFIEWFNNIRVSNHRSVNDYVILIQDFSLYSLADIFIKTNFYYFFYLPHLNNYYYLYYVIEISMTVLFVILLFIYFLNYKTIKISISAYSIDKIIILYIFYFLINSGFAFFNINIGNAIRHKSLTVFMVLLMMPVLVFLIKKLFYNKSSVKSFN